MSKELDAARELVRILEEKEKGEISDSRCLLSELEPGTVINGNDDRQYIVLKHFNKEETMIISKGFMLEDETFDSGRITDYSVSELRKKIDSELLPMFEKDFCTENIVEKVVDLTTVDNQKKYGKCVCKVRPITFDEARELNDLLVNKSLDDWWWTCTSWSVEEREWHSLAAVSPSGNVDGCNSCSDYGVRPICILQSNIFVSKGE